jgi:hypothetical protein
MRVGALGDFAGIGVRYQSRPIPPSMLKKEHQWAATIHRLTEPVGSYESVGGDSKSALIYAWHSDMIAFYQSSLLQGCVLMRALSGRCKHDPLTEHSRKWGWIVGSPRVDDVFQKRHHAEL